MCSFDTNVLPLYPVVQYVSQNQRHKKVVINILFFVFKAVCPDEEDKFQTIRKLRVWGMFQPSPCWLPDSTVWKSQRKTASGNPVAQPSFYRIEQIPGKRGSAPVLELSELFNSCAFCESWDREVFAGKDSQQGQFNFRGRSRGNWHSTSPKHSHFHSYTQISNFIYIINPGDLTRTLFFRAQFCSYEPNFFTSLYQISLL